MRRRESNEWFLEIGTDLGHLSEELSRGRLKVAHAKLWEPRVDIREDPSLIIVRAEIAGVRGEDIRLIYVPERNALLIRGVRHESAPGDRTAAHQLEIYYGEFAREVLLPEVPINAEGVRAQYRNGFLTVLIPKA
jgi:HSP20 family molecular chaperone IbpA